MIDTTHAGQLREPYWRTRCDWLEACYSEDASHIFDKKQKIDLCSILTKPKIK